MGDTHNTIETAVQLKRKGELIFPSDFRGLGTTHAIKKALSRLAQNGKIKRLTTGMYYIPKKDPLFGERPPSAEEVVEMIAKKEKINIKPAGSYALNRLGLTTQVPTRRVYITDGHAKQFSIGKLEIKFKPTTHKRLSRKGSISSLVIQALEELDINNIDKDTEQKIKMLLQNEKPPILKHDLELTPARISDYIVKLLKEKKNDILVKTN